VGTPARPLAAFANRGPFAVAQLGITVCAKYAGGVRSVRSRREARELNGSPGRPTFLLNETNSSKLSGDDGGAARLQAWLRETLRTCTGHAVVGKWSARRVAQSVAPSSPRLPLHAPDFSALPCPLARKHHER